MLTARTRGKRVLGVFGAWNGLQANGDRTVALGSGLAAGARAPILLTGTDDEHDLRLAPLVSLIAGY